MLLNNPSEQIYNTNQPGSRIDGVGFALSGGGFRATLFHLGSLWRLNELGWLKRLTEVTSVSGGSITAGYLGYRWKDLIFDTNGIATNLVDKIVRPLQIFCSHTIDVESVLPGLINPFYPPIKLIAGYYRKGLFGDATLNALPGKGDGPIFTIYATSLQTGSSVRLTRENVADYHLGKLKSENIQLATAVAASCAFPPVLGPVVMKLKPEDWIKQYNGDELNVDKLRSNFLLTDGGVYDNLGLEHIWHRYTTVLASDAGAPFSTVQESLWLQINQLLLAKRVIDVIMEQSRSLRKRWLIADLIEKKMGGTYWGIATQIGDYKLEENGCQPPLIDDNEGTRSLARIRTRLNRFTTEEQEKLINWGYALTDAAMRRHVPASGTSPGRLPFL